MRRHHRYGLIFRLGASLAFRLLCVTDSLQALATHGPLFDDSFYAFSVARNVSRGAGSSFDGEHLTNGYQPLWVGLLVPLYRLVPGEAPIRVALVLSILFNMATGWVLLQLLRRRVSPGSALLGLALWGFAPAIVQQAANGLETSLALLGVSLALWRYAARVRRRPTRRNAIGLGLLLTLAIVARVDALIFAFALAVDMARRRPLWRMGVVVALVGASLLGP